MKILAVHVGRPRDITVDGRTVRTGIFKTPVAGPVHVGRLNLDGDEQADLTVHGGVRKAVYAYPGEHYAFWREALPGVEMPWGVFGENLTTEGLIETEVGVGDVLRAGGARLAVTEPRMPCSKLAARFERRDMVRRFLASRRTGFYLRVLEEGTVQAGDRVDIVERHTHRLPVSEVTEIHASRTPDIHRLRRVAEHPDLDAGWREEARARLERAGG